MQEAHRAGRDASTGILAVIKAVSDSCIPSSCYTSKDSKVFSDMARNIARGIQEQGMGQDELRQAVLDAFTQEISTGKFQEFTDRLEGRERILESTDKAHTLRDRVAKFTVEQARARQ